MATTNTMTTTATTKRHPIRGFLYGIPFGLGIAMIAIGQKWAALGTWPPFILVIVGILVSMLWSTFGPAKAPKDPPPVDSSDAVESEIVPAPDAVTVPDAEAGEELAGEELAGEEAADGEDGLTEGDETD